MWTTALAYLIVVLGFLTFAGGAFGLLMLIFEEMAGTPLRYYAFTVALVSVGLSMIGMGQGLRLLLLLVGRD